MSKPSESRTGACLCGKIKYLLQGKAATPIHNTRCLWHRSYTKRFEASTTGSSEPQTDLDVKGFSITQGEDALKSHADNKTDSGQPLTRKFCGECGSRLFAFTPLNENVVMIAAGTLDDFEDWKPSKEQYCVHRLGFVDKMKGVKSRDRHVTNMRSKAEGVR
ncbi:hypothetical protein LTR48_003909 [Friedmanniomyces endolithicus]|nr:hypothetical protein LTR48_003909 [Friedmanniomyces endolithicus]